MVQLLMGVMAGCSRLLRISWGLPAQGASCRWDVLLSPHLVMSFASPVSRTLRTRCDRQLLDQPAMTRAPHVPSAHRPGRVGR